MNDRIGYANQLPAGTPEPPWTSTPQSSWVLRYRFFNVGGGQAIVQIWFKDKSGNPTVCCEYQTCSMADAWALHSAMSKGQSIYKAGFYQRPYDIVG